MTVSMCRTSLSLEQHEGCAISPALTQIVAFTGQLDEAEQCAGELSIVHIFLSSTTISAHTQTLCLGVALECVQVKH